MGVAEEVFSTERLLQRLPNQVIQLVALTRRVAGLRELVALIWRVAGLRGTS
jgi:hypothetical protein